MSYEQGNFTFYAKVSTTFTPLKQRCEENVSAECKINVLIINLQLFFAFSVTRHFSQATEEQIKLMEYQVKLEEKYRKSFMDLSLSDTIYKV